MTAPWTAIYRAMKADWDASDEFGKRCAIAVFVTQIPVYIWLVFWR